MTDRGRSSSDTLDNRPVRVLKFGGTSLGEPDPFRNAVEIVRDTAEEAEPVVVVSAAAGVTDDLVRAADDTRGDRATAEAWVRQIQRRYRSLAKEVLEEEPLLARYATVSRPRAWRKASLAGALWTPRSASTREYTPAMCPEGATKMLPFSGS